METESRNSPDKYNTKVLKDTTECYAFSFEDDKFSFENTTQFHLLGIIMMFWGILLIFWHPFPFGIFSYILIILSLMTFGFLLVRKYGSFSVLDTSNNNLYREYRLGKFVFFKRKLINLSDIIQFGITHKVGRLVNYGNRLNTIVFNLAFRLFQREEYCETKPFNPTYCGVEKTATIFLTKNGKVGYINNFSYTDDSDINNSILANSLSLYSAIPVRDPGSFKYLTVEKIANKYHFVSHNLRPLFFSEDFVRFIIPLFLLLSTIAFFALLFHFEIL
ncbi:MAG: hypothetical protein J6Z11_14135 [Candidatus Riflebacteria bacterium]|nr:hypothetical protein [Candidatus Riflebacteria bacterium]